MWTQAQTQAPTATQPPAAPAPAASPSAPGTPLFQITPFVAGGASPGPSAVVPAATVPGYPAPIPQQPQPQPAGTPYVIQPQQPTQQPSQPMTGSQIEQQIAALQQQVQQQQQIMQQQVLRAAAAQQQQQQQPRQVATPQTPTAPAKTNILGVPEFDNAKLAFITRNEQGEYVDLPGGIPGTAAEYTRYRAMQAQALANFMNNPEAVIAPMIDQRVKAVSDSIQQQRIAAEQDRIISEVEPWAFERDPNTNRPITDFDWQTGQSVPRLSQAGAMYNHLLQQAASLGISTPANRHQYAMQLMPKPQQPAPAPQVLANQFMPMPGMSGRAAPPVGGVGLFGPAGQSAAPQTIGTRYSASPSNMDPPGLNRVPNNPGFGMPGQPRQTLKQMMQAAAAQYAPGVPLGI